MTELMDKLFGQAIADKIRKFQGRSQRAQQELENSLFQNFNNEARRDMMDLTNHPKPEVAATARETLQKVSDQVMTDSKK